MEQAKVQALRNAKHDAVADVDVCFVVVVVHDDPQPSNNTYA
jgi:non-canonical (house-cleaning) NTP pyrophosphatase